MDRLIELSRDLPVRRVHLASIDECDLAYPIILSSGNRAMDGMHRIAKALKLGHDEVEARRFEVDSSPDHVGIAPRDLPCD